MKSLLPLLFFLAFVGGILLLSSSSSSFTSASASHNNNNNAAGPSQLFASSSTTGTTKIIEELATVDQITSLVRDRHRASVVVFYDSADLNSWRAKPAIEEGAELLAGFTRVLAADVRNPNVTMLRAAWGVSTVPWIYGIGPKYFKPREEFAASPSSLHLLTGVRGPIPRMPHFGDLNAQGMRKFGLGLVAESALVIQNVETQSQLQSLEKEIAQVQTQDVSTTNSHQQQRQQEFVPLVVLLTDKDSSSLLYRAIAANYARRAAFFEVNVKKLPVAAKTFDAQRAPHLMVFSAGNSKALVYQGQLNIQALDAFLKPLVADSFQVAEQRLFDEHASALSREGRRRESPLLLIDSKDDWITEVDQRAGVVGIIAIPGKSGDNAEAVGRARKAVEELREKEAKKKMRSNVVQFVGFSRGGGGGGDSVFGKLEETLLKTAFGVAAVDEERRQNYPEVYFISSRKKVATKFVGALSGDSLYGFMKNELKNGVGVKPVEMEELKKVL